jgi:hypothetical protein
MLGAINGQYINRYAIDGNSVYGLSFANLIATQANATVASAGVLATGCGFDAAQDHDELSALATTATSAMPVELLADDQFINANAAAAVASMAQLLSADDTLKSFARGLLKDHGYGTRMTRHEPGKRLTPHGPGSKLTAH